MAHLYLMQNCHGLIKIGRSINPGRRRKALESEERCRIEIVAVQEEWGQFEEEIHNEMAEFRLVGEWFDGDDLAMEISLIHFGLPPDTEWPFVLDEDAANAWLEQFEGWRDYRSIQREVSRTLQSLREATAGGPYADFRVWLAMWQFIRGKNWHVIADHKTGRDFVHRDDGEPPSPLLPYTTDVAAALTLWPEERRPASWSGTALECCMAALSAELSVLRTRYGRDR